MKKTIRLGVLAALCLVQSAYAQENITQKGLRPGQALPALPQLAAYSGQLLILDFWATWCAPCRAMIPKSDSLNQQFQGRAHILPVTYENRQVAAPVLDKVRQGHPAADGAIYSDTQLQSLFPHRSLPHYVWIDARGVVRAFTEAEEINPLAIQAALNGTFPTRQKQDLRVPYRATAPLFTDGNGGPGTSVRYHSLLSGFVPGLSGGLNITRYDPVKGQLFTVRNVPLVWLYRLAYGEGGRWFSPNRIRCASRDSLQMTSELAGQAYDQWLSAGYGYCYELQLPPALTTQAFPILQEEMRRLFPAYQANVERVKTRCLALVRTGKEDLLKSKGGTPRVRILPFSCEMQNADLSRLMVRLDHQYLQLSPLPLVDETGYAGKADLNFKADLSNVAEINAGLKPYGLQLVEKMAGVDLLVIRDHSLTP